MQKEEFERSCKHIISQAYKVFTGVYTILNIFNYFIDNQLFIKNRVFTHVSSILHFPA